jgi:hypothetical protein
VGGELHGEAAHAAGRADDEDGVAFGEVEGVDGSHRGDGRKGRGTCGRDIDVRGPAGDGGVSGDGDELRPAAVADGGVGVQEKAEDLVAGRVVGNVVTDLLDDAGVVAAEGDGVLVLDAHAGEHAGGDAVVDGVGRGGLHPNEHLALTRRRGGQVVASGRRGAGLVERDGIHAVSSVPESAEAAAREPPGDFIYGGAPGIRFLERML